MLGSMARLDSWKEIAAYLGRGLRTVQRWEREEGLPVHRLAHDKRGTIYANREELDAWWESRRVTLVTATGTDAGTTPAAPRFERVTWTAALTGWPALSSDARLIAYVSDGGQDGTTPQIWIQQIGGAALRVTSGERQYSHLSFSPDDTRIVFTATDDAGPKVYDVPALGGEPRLLQRSASCGCISPDGRWFAHVPHDTGGIRIAARGGAGFRTVAPDMSDVVCMTWSPDSGAVVVHARLDSAGGPEPDWWMVPIDGSPPANTGIVQRFREAGMFVLPTRVACAGHSLVFSAAGPRGVQLYRQRLDDSRVQPVGAPEQLTTGGDGAYQPMAAAGHVSYFSSRADANLWSVALDATTGIAQGPLRRMSRGLAPLGYLSLTKDFGTLAYFSFRLGNGDVFLRALATGAEKMLTDGPDGAKGYPAISPNGQLLAYGTRMPGGQPLRPIFIANLTDGTWRTLGDDCGGRPREWVDERWLLIERFARLHSIALIDTATGAQHELLAHREQSVTNPRLSPDRRYLAFDASHPGQPAAVYAAPFGAHPIPESAWVLVDRAASHPFWSADGTLLYYTPTGANPLIRSAVRGRRFNPTTGRVEGDSIAVYAATEMLMPAYPPGTAPIATPDEIILVLGDFRGDVWLRELEG